MAGQGVGAAAVETLVTLLVAALGIVSLVSYLNRLRRREMAIRVALGAAERPKIRHKCATIRFATRAQNYLSH